MSPTSTCIVIRSEVRDLFLNCQKGLAASLAACLSISGSLSSRDRGVTKELCMFQLSERYLLPASRNQDADRKCVVIDLDETLVHSSFKVRQKISLAMLFLDILCFVVLVFLVVSVS